MNDPLDEKIGRILFSEEVGAEQQLSETERMELEALRYLEERIREMLNFDPTKVEPTQDPLPHHLRARLETERLRIAMPGAGKTSSRISLPAFSSERLDADGGPQVVASENKPTYIPNLKEIPEASPMATQDSGATPEIGETAERVQRTANDGQCASVTEITKARVKMSPWWATAAAALFICLLAPLAFWATSERGGQEVTIKSTDLGEEASTVLLTPGSETGFTTPRVIWFSSRHRSARVIVRSLDLPAREWVSENHGGELAWSDFSPSGPLNAGKEYRLDILVDGKSVAARNFKVANAAKPLEVKEEENLREVVADAQNLRAEGNLRDALMRLGAVTDTLRKSAEIRELRGEITAEILTKKEK